MTAYEKAYELIEIIGNAGFEAYLVGGCVRDSLMGSDCDDIDIACSATPCELETVLDNSGIRYIETGIKHGTVTVLFGSYSYEITTFRTDGKYSDNRHPENVEFVRSIEDDLSRRDFTVNALAYSKERGLVDLFGGREDIDNRIIRAVGNADTRFQEDALRIMRALRFACVLGFEIEGNTKKAVFNNKELLKNVSGERIFAELRKLLSGKNVFNILTQYREVFAVVLPEIAPCFSCMQNTPWHIYDVWTHTCKSVELVKNEPELKFIMLLHDIGKPYSKTTDENGIDHFKGHQAISAQMALPILKRLKVSNEFSNRIMAIIPIHDRHIGSDKKKIKRLLSQLGESGLRDLIEVKKADKLAQNLKLTADELRALDDKSRLLDEIINQQDVFTVRQLDINGNDLKALGFSGREIGSKLSLLLDAVIDEKLENKKEKLIEYIK